MRVIAGTARGRPLRAPKSEATRPTGDLIKGVVFSMLEAEALKRGYDVDEEGRMASGQAWPRVLDLFAGSGALGIEALSRGAEQADFVEQAAEAARLIQANLRTIGFEQQATVHQLPVGRAVARLAGPVDAAFLDPPYADQGALASALEALARPGLLAERSVVVLEQASTASPPEHVGLLPMRNTRTHGRTRITLYATPPERV